MSRNIDKLRKLLAELFQFDQADLDFGIYRIINMKRTEIVRFLETDLLPQVKEAFRGYQSADKKTLETELNVLIERLRADGVEPEASSRVKDLRKRISETAVDVGALEDEVFSDLCNFLRRYYHEGDFLSLRRYKKDVYALPYEGEEVKLHWANADQYYIKTTENFRDYTFKLPDGRRVHFKLAEASTEKDNNKPVNGNERRFVLCEKDPLVEENGELFIRFEYRSLNNGQSANRGPEAGDAPANTKKKAKKTAAKAPEAESPDPEPAEDDAALRGGAKQAEINSATVKRVLSLPGFAAWTNALSVRVGGDGKADRTLLENRLAQYTSSNTFDYFIHKDLGGFLRRELDFFIKNEVMQLDDIEEQTAPRVEQYLSKIKVLRKVAHQIIDLLTQIENFQKKLWLKKKFVVETQYCVTLDRVPEDLYPEIVANDAQREEWVRLFAINEIESNLNGPGYTKPLTVEFLKSNPFLVLDTKFFGDNFKQRVTGNANNLDLSIDGTLVNADNFHALTLISECYRGRTKAIYIDPPYNTGPSEILYKNGYRKSSWLSLMENRLSAAEPLVRSGEASLCIAIDDFEYVDLIKLVEQLFSGFDVNSVIVNHHPQGSGGANVSRTHEYAVFLTPAGLDLLRVERDEGGAESAVEHRPFMRSGTAENNYRAGRPNSFYAVLVDKEMREVRGVEPPPPLGQAYPRGDTPEGWRRIYPISRDGAERVWRLSYETANSIWSNGGIACSANLTLYQVVSHRSRRGVPTSNWTGKKYNAGTHGTNLIREILGAQGAFSYPKSLFTVMDCVDAMTCDDTNGTVVDFFAGSGTTGHAVVELNRVNETSIKYVLVEMGRYFDTVTKPRMQKVIYSRDWKDGKPASRSGTSHMFKYFHLESYEDALNNIALKRDSVQDGLLTGHRDLREDYMLRYMLDVESRGSPSLLDVKAFRDPFAYKMKIARGDETRETTVDLVETFNWLLGLTVRRTDDIRGVRMVEGTSPAGEKVIVLWRNTDAVPADKLEQWFAKQRINPRDMEFDLIYINGDNTIENLRRPDETWKVRLIEEEFHRLMFEGTES